MRELAFRAWDKQQKQFLDDIQDGWGDEGNYPAFVFYLNNDNFVVEQYTEVNDKDSKKIYVGDLLEVYCEEDKQTNPYVVEDLRSFYRAIDTDDHYLRINQFMIKVLGNIHENPELVK